MPKDKDPNTSFTLDVETPSPDSPKASLLERLRSRIFGNKEPLEQSEESLERAKLIETVTSQLKAFDEEYGFPRKDYTLYMGSYPMPPVTPEMMKLAELAFNDSLEGQDRSLLKGAYDYDRQVIEPMYHRNSPAFARYGFFKLPAPTSATWYESFSNMVHPL